MAGLLAGLPLDLLLSPWALALLGLAVGSFLNVVVHRLPLMLERQWWGDVAAQLADGESSSASLSRRHRVTWRRPAARWSNCCQR